MEREPCSLEWCFVLVWREGMRRGWDREKIDTAKCRVWQLWERCKGDARGRFLAKWAIRDVAQGRAFLGGRKLGSQVSRHVSHCLTNDPHDDLADWGMRDVDAADHLDAIFRYASAGDWHFAQLLARADGSVREASRLAGIHHKSGMKIAKRLRRIARWVAR